MIVRWPMRFYPSHAGGTSSGKRRPAQSNQTVSIPAMLGVPHQVKWIFDWFAGSVSIPAMLGVPHQDTPIQMVSATVNFRIVFPRQTHPAANQGRTNKVQEIENATLIQFYQYLIHFPRQKTVSAIFVVSAYGLKWPTYASIPHTHLRPCSF